MEDPKILAAIITSVLSLVGAIAAGVISITGQRRLRVLEAELRSQAESADFLATKLDKFYLPVSMHLSANGKLFDRFFHAEDAEKRAIEHELREHNTKVRDLLMNASIYSEPDAPEAKLEALLEHLIQWDIVYKLKYDYKVYNGPVFAGIEEFGFRGFPRKQKGETESLDDYFKKKVRELKARHHERLKFS